LGPRGDGRLVHQEFEGLGQGSSAAQRCISNGESTGKAVFGDVGKPFMETFDKTKDLAALGELLAGAFTAAR
jgi:hypothetical protein